MGTLIYFIFCIFARVTQIRTLLPTLEAPRQKQ